jgi:hypothetical protein
MSLPRRIAERKERDADMERELRIRKNDPLTERYGGVTYSPADIEALENERLPWLKRKRNRS